MVTEVNAPMDVQCMAVVEHTMSALFQRQVGFRLPYSYFASYAVDAVIKAVVVVLQPQL